MNKEKQCNNTSKNKLIVREIIFKKQSYGAIFLQIQRRSGVRSQRLKVRGRS